MQKPEMIYDFTISIDYKQRRHSIRTTAYEVIAKNKEGITLRLPSDLTTHTITRMEYQSVIDKRHISELKPQLIEEIETHFSPTKLFTFVISLKSDEPIKEFQLSDMIMSMVKSHLFARKRR